ncbi:NADPH-dependent FMN reductase [Peredibacter starrii]|uniref:NAD(P)H-dependent oxidoreductase n=1 Tax=Peredibacter starrii TaxID=28202 RepID=A0AAX4HLQ3_9BACT|nr:NAD(P)H-dependent oxidoreductase [Peredibacter starrii]WPU64097.1 NAD(P)H-dependent oxidoreductase [Peredibacter starrii]
MEKKNIVILTASEVKNLELAQKFKESLESQNANVSIINMVELDLPLYSSRTESKFTGAELLKGQMPLLEQAHGYVFIAPEYNGSTPPVFNNFLAWLSRSSKDWRNCLNGRPAAIATFSGGGGFNVLLAMRTQLAFIGMNVIGRQILTHSNKVLDEKSLLSVSQELVKLCL